MPVDESAVIRVLDELLWMLRRRGFVIATSQAIDAARAVRMVGLSSREVLREALAVVVVQRVRDRARFDRVFDDFFAHRSGRDLWERLSLSGLTDREIDEVKLLLEAYAQASPQGTLGALVQRGAELDRLLQLAFAARALEGMQSPLQAGYFTHRLLDELGVWRAKGELDALRARLFDSLGPDRADVVIAALERERTLAADEVRSFVTERIARRPERPFDLEDDASSRPLAMLDPAATEEVHRAVRVFVERLRGGESVRRRRARRGRIDLRATLRRSLRTGGVPFVLARRARRLDRPKLMVLCDISESVRSVASFMLQLVHAMQSLFSGTRSFVFVSELGETTRLFDDLPASEAMVAALCRVVPTTENSNYGRAFRSFRDAHLRSVDRRTTVVVVGDGRSNYQDPEVAILDDITARARALVWLCPEPRAAWATGDSAMRRYAPKCTAVLEVQTAQDLEEAARLLRSFR